MSADQLEIFLARLFTDTAARARFCADPHGESERAGLTRQETEAVVEMDRVGLELAARSFSRKREQKRRAASWFLRALLWLRGR